MLPFRDYVRLRAEKGELSIADYLTEQARNHLQVPLPQLMDDRNMELEVSKNKGNQVLVTAYTYEAHRIWGATARKLRQILELLA